MATKLNTFQMRSEFSGCLDLVRVAAALLEWAVKQNDHKVAVRSMTAAADVLGCAEMVVVSTMTLDEIAALMLSLFVTPELEDCHRVYETLNYIEAYDGDVVR